ncbi:ABC transporter ATP-binding protein [Vulcanimicrobium alpinum]|uniref:ABC transporter ATP-binding protein n=1 Tax=Vulcanimicrobium alpinum TaxID=3016050 RepID=A0AAN1XUT2_UNVUL|nr:ABC-F family ATP-binding cassette domain-containing protein [Vulcanimicrobium alpinum]BDE05852.1 ABC transporter ATP-binding protein [Vulcanimicrobium alpinum]
MELLRFSGLARHYGAHEVFSDLAGVMRDGDKIGLVGPNGAGKSSLVRLLVGRDEPDGGTIARARERRLGYLAQDAAESGPATLRAAFDEALARGDAAEWEMRATLNRFDFAESDLDRPLREFSGGQRTRALLARTLLESPDWLVLDEPTNHLDLDTVRWLETFVARDPRAFVIVSHDRYFLETVAGRIWELDRGELAEYDVEPGRAYSDYLEQRETRREQQRRDFEAFQTERKRQKAVIDELRTHGSHNYSHVRSREKAFAKMGAVEAPRSEKRAISVALRAARRATGGPAVDVLGVAKAYDRPLFSGLTAHFVRGDRVAIVGPNGAGKSTFLRIISGELQPDRGSVRYGTGLRTAAYSQSSVDDLPAGRTAAEAVMQMGVTDEEARSLLGRLNLGGDAGDKPVEAFSGGERRRIMLARLMAQRADCLFLDEPTNDLDIPSREALEDVLASYEGALFVVSHDRYLLKRLAERVVAIRDGAATVFDGDYASYERAQHQGRAGTDAPRAAVPAKAEPVELDRRAAHEAKLELGRRKRAVADAEKRVADLDRKKAELELEFAAPGLYDDPDEVVRLQREMDRVNAESGAAMEAWELAVESLDGFTSC